MSGLCPIEERGACNVKSNCKHTEEDEDKNDDDAIAMEIFCTQRKMMTMMLLQWKSFVAL